MRGGGGILLGEIGVVARVDMLWSLLTTWSRHGWINGAQLEQGAQ